MTPISEWPIRSLVGVEVDQERGVNVAGCRLVVRPFAALIGSGLHMTPVDLRLRGAIAGVDCSRS